MVPMIFIFGNPGGGGGGGGGGTPSQDHVHVEEDLTSQADGSKLTFETSQTFIEHSLIVIYNGVSYTRGNDFEEEDESGNPSTKKFTLVNDDPFPPDPSCPLYVTYRRTPN